MIYFDNAATSLVKPAGVEHAVISAMRILASPGRGSHVPAMKAAEKVYDCRIMALELFNAENPENIVFTSNATHALNIAINSLVNSQSTVLISGFEHNSVLRPVAARTEKIIIAGRKLFDSDDTLQSFKNNISKADVVICTYVSNVFGYILPVYEIGELCRKHNVPYIVDASQAAGILPVDVKKLGAEFVAMPGHKSLMGPQGTGILICNAAAKPLLYGGSGSNSISRQMPEFLPDKLEAGTHNVCGIAGLLEGMKFVKEKGTENILKHETELAEIMKYELDDSGYKLFSTEKDCMSGVMSITCDKFGCDELAEMLAENNICVRAGLHCSPLSHESAETIENGTVRFSFSPFNTKKQVYDCCKILKEFIS